MNPTILRSVAVISTIATITQTARSAELTCNQVLGIAEASGRQLYNREGGASLPDGVVISIGRQSKLHLAYTTSGHQYTSGAVIIKLRHKIVDQHPPTQNPIISLRRDRYVSPCIGRGTQAIKEFRGSSDTQRYRNYHFYGLPDNEQGESSLDRLHAEIGNRPARTWYEPNNRCASTADWDIAPQFMFDDEERRVVRFAEYFTYRVSTTYNSQKQGTAYAAPPAYTEYQNLAVRVVPYRKPQNRLACVSFTIGIPEKAVQSDVMVIDADDARYPRISPFQDPQKTWQFKWL